ncbi:pyrroline-5-carboxylate reductase [Pantoea sp. ACRSH]|uniref:pyrroline-5-carboxylate reductase n=1 Tax=unclassified Pantoea TaxID=2630326 RepID=UPI001EF5DD35|nr:MULTISPECIES: pyrroline-5-carboxylate reductase [unclassified Pantoea]MCG7365182.1 pyrroline-5-carboxylate reductase [Pantoea sp. ACRSH]MCG7394942.1 pyrroline-5-carboxylate reductase [Pantoea sp. ACRSC]
MLEKKIGFIGGGNMAKAIIGGLVKSGQIAPSNIWVFDRKAETNEALAREYGIQAAESAEVLAREVDILFGAVKPNVILKVLKDLASQLKKEALVISIAAGVTLDSLATVLGHDRKIVRVMPNTPALVNEGMTSVTPNVLVEQPEIDEVVTMFESFGKAAVVSEYLIHSVVGVSGSAPAYVFMFIEAMADAAVLGGMPRAQAYQFAAQAVKGSAQMVLESGKHPAELKDMVCSPGGTTIEAVKVLEEKGFRAAVMEAMQQCMAKSEALSKK